MVLILWWIGIMGIILLVIETIKIEIRQTNTEEPNIINNKFNF